MTKREHTYLRTKKYMKDPVGFIYKYLNNLDEVEKYVQAIIDDNLLLKKHGFTGIIPTIEEHGAFNVPYDISEGFKMITND